MKSVRILAALGAAGLVSLPVSAQAQTAPTRLSISSFGTSNPAFGSNYNPAFGGISIRPRIVINRITVKHPLPGFPIRRGIPAPPKPPKSNAAI